MRFFTILLMSVCALVGSMRAMADDALSTLIGDNKVWNYRTKIFSGDKFLENRDSYSLYCKGKIEKNGKEYTIISYLSDNEELAYIREEDGRSYISSDSPVFKEGGSIRECANIDPEYADLPELPLFDFSAEVGDTFQGLVNWERGYRIGELEVKKAYTKTVGDYNVRVLTVTAKVRYKFDLDSDEESEYILGDETVVQGIGYLPKWFFMPRPLDFTTSMNEGGSVPRFKSLTDRDGNQIITYDEIFPPAPPKPRDYAHTIRKDRTWVYSFVKDGVEETKSLHFGDEIHNDYGYYYPVIDEKGETVAHLAYGYFDDSKVFRLAEDNPEIAKLFIDHSWYNGDYTLYVFRLGDSECYDTAARLRETGEYQILTVGVESNEVVMVDGEKCRRQVVTSSRRGKEKFVIVEGIGANTGWLYEPAWGNPKAYEVNGLATLKEVLDGEGNVIFRYENFGPTNAVEDVLDDVASENDPRMFDLFGREIRDPRPGTIYVQGGRKFVAR